MPIRIAAPSLTGQGEQTSRAPRVLFALAVVILSFAVVSCRDSPAPRTQPLSPELEQVMAQVAAIRSLPASEDIDAGVVPRGEVRRLLAGTLTRADHRSFEQLTVLYRLLGLIGRGDDYESLYLDFAERALIGFYEPANHRFWVVGDADEVDFASFDATLRSTTAHEFIHALQDTAFDLATLLERASPDLDWSLALSAVIEGDAVFHERLWALEHIAGSSVGRVSGPTAAGGGIPAAIERELRFPYDAGLDWVSLAGATEGNARTGAILGGRRITTAEVLHPGSLPSGWEPEAVELPELSAYLGKGWKRASGGSFGEFRLRNLLQLQLGGLQAVDAAAGWQGDRYDVYANEDRSVAVLELAFRDDADTAEFGVAMAAWLRAAGTEIRADGAATSATFADGRAVLFRPVGDSRYLLIFASDQEVAAAAAALLEDG